MFVGAQFPSLGLLWHERLVCALGDTHIGDED